MVTFTLAVYHPDVQTSRWLSALVDLLQSTRPDVAAPLLEILGEVLDNALTHGFSDAGVRVQLYQSGRTVNLTVADSGIGIRNHLARGGLSTTNDVEAIRAATRPGTTASHPPRGYGLSDSIDTLEKMPKASLAIASGNGRGRFYSGGKRVFEETATTIQGTVAILTVAEK